VAAPRRYDVSAWCERGEHESCQGRIWVAHRPFSKGDRSACVCECHGKAQAADQAVL